jgi:transcriptional regulator of acetoin/glycerol metabolism
MGGSRHAGAGGDLAERARRAGRAHAAFLAGHPVAPGRTGLPEVVVRSWARAARAGVDPEGIAPVVLADGDLASYRAAHPLARVIALLRHLVGGVADDGGHLMAVSDAAGRLLWVEGHRGERRRAAAMNFVEGAAWDEANAGTNAPGTALTVDRPVHIFATEHFRHQVQGWTCAAAPIHDSATGQILGVIDVTGGDVVAHPHSLALVRAAARAAECELATRGGAPPRSETAALVAPVWLEVLGRDEGTLHLPGRTVRLNRRHSEVLVLLLAHPLGLTGEQLADALYDGLDPATVRVELTRLRQVVGRLLQSRPYRLTSPVRSDHAEVAAALRRGDPAAAVAAYAGPLLPNSEAPGVVAERRWMEARLRSAVLGCDDPELLLAWAERFGSDDLEPWERLAEGLPHGSARRAAAVARACDLRVEYGLVPHVTLR